MGSEHNPTEAGTLILLTRLAKQAMRRTDFEALGIDARLLMALSYLGDHDGAPQQEFVDALCIDAKNVVLLLNELEDCGHLVRRRDSEDRRRHRVFITESGRGVLARAFAGTQGIEDEILAALDAEERATLRRLVLKALRGAEPAPECAVAPDLTAPVS